MRILFVFIFFSLAFAACQPKTANLISIPNTQLAFNLEQGKTYKQSSNSTTSIIQDVNGQKTNITMTIKGTISFFVKSVTDTTYQMDTKFEHLGMVMQMPDGTIEFDSDKDDAADIFSLVFGAMKNEIFEVTMSKQGKIMEVKNIENLFEAAINQFDEIPAAQKEQIKTQLSQAYGADAMKGSIEMVTAIYPDKPVHKGDKWAINTNLQSTMSVKISTVYEFADLTPNYAFIKGKSSMNTTAQDDYIESNGILMKQELTGSMVSEIKVDKNTGWIIEAKIKQELTGNSYIKETPHGIDDMKIPMTMLNEMIITNN